MRPPAVAGADQTGSRARSASATAASQPPLASMSPPATKTGFAAAISRCASACTSAGSAPARPSTVRVVWWRIASSSTCAAQSSIGIETNTGPCGASAARWVARASACGTSSARGGS
jgi:hypothetical protein